MGGGGIGGAGGGDSGRVGWGGVQVGQFGVVGGGGSGGAIWGVGGGGQRLPLPPLTLPPSNHTITINLTLTFAASWFGHASHVDWVEQDPPNLPRSPNGCFCHIIALHFGPQHLL